LINGDGRGRSRAVSGLWLSGGDLWLLSIPPFPIYRAAALAERIGNGAVRRPGDIEFSLYTLECPGLAFGDSEGVLSWRCFEGGTPSCGTIRWLVWGGDGVDLDNGLLL
jgi:hypothetical protein